ncbi:hypothetical protein KBI23_23370 [bacterium]|nr:hypothetical protein [bacterium]MBP9809762.1 hypothetical protein [bacterium]
MFCNSRSASKEELALYLAATPDDTTLLVQNYSQTELPDLPDSLTSLRLYHCPSLTALPKLPQSLNDLWIHNCPNLAKLPNFPSTLTFLLIAECMALGELPAMAEGLKDLRLNLTGVTELPALPKSLMFLRVVLPGIKNLPELPSTLERLHLSGCSGLVGRNVQVGNLRIKID